MMHTTTRRSVTAGFGVAAAAFAAALLAPTAHAAPDDIDMYGGTDTSVFTLFNGAGPEDVFTTTTNYFETVNETTGQVTLHFSGPTTVETLQALDPGVTQEGGFSFVDSNTQFFGDLTNLIQTTIADTDAFLANGGDLSNFVPLLITNIFSPPIMDADLFPF